MATSGSADYNRTASQIILGALRVLNVLGRQTIDSTDETNALEALELMVKSWQAEGLHLWTQTDATLFLVPSTNKYSLAGANAANTSDVINTTLSAAEAASQTVISVTSSTGMAAADVVGIVTDDDTTHWSTIATVDSSTQITIDDATDSAAASGNAVHTYTTALGRPLRITSMRRLNSDVDVPMIELSNAEYFNLPSKKSEASPVEWYYDPQLGTGALYLWPTPDTVDDVIRFTYWRSIEDADAVSNDLDFPAEWLECLKYNLALRLAPEYGKPIAPEAAMLARELKEKLEDFDQEEASVYFSGSSDKNRFGDAHG